MACRAEFIIEPFEEGLPGPHVMAAVDAVRAHGFEPEIGPFGTSIEGEKSEVIAAIQGMLATACNSGVSRINLQLDLEDRP